jgi:DNA-3-methyladenine glycosylase
MGESLAGNLLWIEDHGENVPDAAVLASARVGLAYAGAEAAGLPWRFRVRDSRWTSTAK